MNDHRLKLLVNEAVALDQQIAEFSARLKEIKAELKAEAESRQDDATATEGGGTSIIFEGSLAICRVTRTGRALKDYIDSDKLIEKVSVASKGLFEKFFQPIIGFKPAPNFRESVEQQLDPREAARLIKLCENPGKTTVSFETKEKPL